MESLQAEVRKARNRSALRKVRELDRIPGVLYGKDTNNIPLSVDRRNFKNILEVYGKNGVIPLEIDGSRKDVVVIDYQRDPFTMELTHVDFLTVDADTEIETEVRVSLVGEAFGVKDGGVLQQPLFALTVVGRPSELPEVIEINVEDMKVGDTLYVRDIRDLFNFKIAQRDEDVIASILPPKQEEEISTGEEQEPGIPENLEGRETQEVED